MENLPDELVYLVTGYTSAWNALLLLNRQYNRIVTPLLYKSVKVTSWRAITAFIHTIKTGNLLLREYPKLLHLAPISPLLGDSHDLKLAVKQMLMSVPNVTELVLHLEPAMIHYLIDEPQYPFMLRNLDIRPFPEVIFVQFLEVQPHIEHLRFEIDRRSSYYYDDDSWAELAPYMLNSRILPHLKSIEAEQSILRIMVPNRPISNITVGGFCYGFDFHDALAASSVPVTHLWERVELRGQIWDTFIVSSYFPSLEFCQTSLTELTLEISASHLFSDSEVPLQFLNTNSNPSHGLTNLRNHLSGFTGLEKLGIKCTKEEHNVLPTEFCEAIPELSNFSLWEGSCPTLKEVAIFGAILKK